MSFEDDMEVDVAFDCGAFYSYSGGELKGFEVDMEVDDDDCVDVAFSPSLSVPSFLNKVFVNEIASSNMVLIVAVHAVLLESGFVGFDPLFPSPLQLHYTIPQLLSSKGKAVQTVFVQFQSTGKLVNVFGSLMTNKVFTCHLCLDESRLIPAFNSVWKNGNTGRDLKDVFEFSKNVKDDIALPLLIDLCESVGLAPPSCFMQLPTDIKLNILELVSGTDIARVACVCAELRSITSNDALWRQKYEEEFWNGAENMGTAECSWKTGFGKTWIWKMGLIRTIKMSEAYKKILAGEVL